MKFTLGWLKEHLETSASLEEICEKLTAIGHEMESVENPAELFAPFKVAYVKSAEKHPDADRLKVCLVETDQGEVQVVCGAPNARTGMKGVFAPAGSYVPGTDLLLKKGVIRGVESNGMLVSEREMGLSDDHDGIIDVSDRDPEIGTPFTDLYNMNDPVIEIGLTPNRPDCAGVRGIARDLAAAGLGTLKPLNLQKPNGTFKSPVDVSLKFDEDTKDACPLFLGCMIKGVENKPSPDWMQARLKAVGLRPISALVDITNYLSLDLCRPLHVFDADKLKGDIHVRLAEKWASLEALNEKTYTLDDFMTAVCDESGIVALGGVIGGVPTSCTEETKNVFVECAYFDPFRTAKTGRALQVESDARYRFERGIDPDFTVDGINVAIQMILDLCGGEPSEIVQAGDVPVHEKTISFDTDFTTKLGGSEIEAAEQIKILESLGFECQKDGSAYKVTPPSWRPDIDGRADLVEEILRIHGYDNIPAVSVRGEDTVTRPAETPLVTRARIARSTLAVRGLQECVTWSFMNKDLAAQFGANDNLLTLTNPVSVELGQMRPCILPNLIEAAARNTAKGFPDCAFFEVGPDFQSNKLDGQRSVAAGIRHLAQSHKHWAQEERENDVFDVKSDAMSVLETLGVKTESLQTRREASHYYHPGRSATLQQGKNILAQFGEIHPGILEEMDVKGPVVGFEVFLDNIPEPRRKGSAKPLLALSQLQPLARDFAFIVDEGVEVDAMIRAAQGVDKNLIQSVRIFDIYQGEHIETGKKSVAMTVILQPSTQTLTDSDIEGISRKIIDMVSSKTGGVLRG